MIGQFHRVGVSVAAVGAFPGRDPRLLTESTTEKPNWRIDGTGKCVSGVKLWLVPRHLIISSADDNPNFRLNSFPLALEEAFRFPLKKVLTGLASSLPFRDLLAAAPGAPGLPKVCSSGRTTEDVSLE